MKQTASLKAKVVRRMALFALILGAALSFSAWTLKYWQGWLFLVVFMSANISIVVYLSKKDPELLKRRMRGGPRAETQKSQKIIQVFTQTFFIALLLFPGFDRRFGWSHVPVWAAVTGNGLVVLGLAIVFFVLRENTYAASTIQVCEEQKVISTGPYRYVRHPLYAGFIVMVIGIPIALGSAWGLLFCVPLNLTIVWRLIEEEKFLAKNLAGYEEFRAKTRYRLVPGLF